MPLTHEQQIKTGPITRLFYLLLEDGKNISVFLIYAVIISLLYLAIPLGAQILVNTIAAGVLFQPLLLLSVCVLIGLVFLGVMRILQLYITEILQRKIFAKISLNMAEKIPKIKQKYFSTIYAPELVNRFFDTVSIQKNLTELLLEVPAAILQIIIGIIIMGIYSPYLIVFDVLLVMAIISIILLGYKGIETSIDESTSKYKVAHWLEELARCQVSFKLNGAPPYLIEEADKRVVDYIDNRKRHFRVLLRQFSASYLVEAIASAGVLAVGGWLVIHGNLSLGQLVASELIILMILSAKDKIVQKLASWYDLVTSMEKVSKIDKLECERSTGSRVKRNPKGADITIEDISFAYNKERPIFDKLNMKIEAGSRASLVGISGSGKTTLAYLIAGLIDANKGNIVFNGTPLTGLDLVQLREEIALVSGFGEIFTGTVEENITLGRKNVNQVDLDLVIDLVELQRDIKQYPQGLQTQLMSEGRNISLGQRQRILLARSIITGPQLLILDEAFGGMDERTKLKIINKLFAEDRPWTVLNITHDAEVVESTDYIHVLDKGTIIEEGRTVDLVDDDESKFTQLFPELYRLTHNREEEE